MSTTLAEPTRATVVEPPLAALIDRMERRSTADIGLLGRPLDAWRRETRAAVGLPTDAPIVMTGHQAGIWHAGILAKWLLADAIRERTGGAIAALVVDQDVNAASSVDYPAIGLSPSGGTSIRRATLAATPAWRAGPTATRPAVTLAAPSEAPAPEIAVALDRIRTAVNAASSAPSLARQMAAANASLLDAAGIARGATTLFATELLASPLGAALLGAMRDDPAACRRAYNEALRLDPRVARPLGEGELPLWRLGPRGREPVRADDLSGSIAPRAFLMTAFARLALADLFLHGTGGGRYERVTDAWIERWLGVRLPPIGVASATLHLPLARHLGDGPIVSQADLRRFEFDPDGVAGRPSADVQRLLESIAAAPRGSLERRERYRQLLLHRSERQRARADELTSMRERLRATADRARSVEVATSRTWPWPLHDRAAIESLRAALRG